MTKEECVLFGTIIHWRGCREIYKNVARTGKLHLSGHIGLTKDFSWNRGVQSFTQLKYIQNYWNVGVATLKGRRQFLIGVADLVE